MNIKKQISKIAIVLSTLVLTLFLLYFLTSEYNREKARVDREVGYMFMNAVKSVEGDFFNKLLFAGDSSDNLNINLSSHLFQKDSSKTITLIGRPNVNKSIKSTTIKIENRTTAQHEVNGILSMIVDMNVDTMRQRINDTCVDTITNSEKDYLPLIKKAFEKSLTGANLKLHYEILSDSVAQTEDSNIMVAAYSDVRTHRKIFVKMGNNSYYILSNMWGSIALSLGLLALILITFYTINAQWTEQQKLYTQKNDFIQNMTHELKTPISTLSVALEAVTNFDAANDAIKREEYISIARNEAGKISLLVDKVLSLSVLEESAHKVSLQPINLDLLLNEIVGADFSNSQLATVNYTNHYKNTFILADKEWMHIVVQSILDNAVKYHEGNDCTIYINTKVAASNYIDIEIIDNNAPIPNDIKDKVFEKFYRMPHGNIHNVKGHGLGLYYAKRMMEMMNGKVVLESTSEGNKFILKCKTTGAG